MTALEIFKFTVFFVLFFIFLKIKFFKKVDKEKYKIALEPSVVLRRRIILGVLIIIFIVLFIPLKDFWMKKSTNCLEVSDGVVTWCSDGTYHGIGPHDVKASFEVDGNAYTAMGYKDKYVSVGEKVKVHYNKDNPEDSYIFFPAYEKWWYEFLELIDAMDLIIIGIILYFEIYLKVIFSNNEK